MVDFGTKTVFGVGEGSEWWICSYTNEKILFLAILDQRYKSAFKKSAIFPFFVILDQKVFKAVNKIILIQILYFKKVFNCSLSFAILDQIITFSKVELFVDVKIHYKKHFLEFCFYRKLEQMIETRFLWIKEQHLIGQTPSINCYYLLLFKIVKC